MLNAGRPLGHVYQYMWAGAPLPSPITQTRKEIECECDLQIGWVPPHLHTHKHVWLPSFEGSPAAAPPPKTESLDYSNVPYCSGETLPFQVLESNYVKL